MNLKELQASWKDEESYHKEIHDSFCELVKNDEVLNRHRTWVRENFFGFGEDSFHWFWKLLCDELPKGFTFLEIGVFRSQILSLIKLLRSDARVFGITPLDTSGDVWKSNYAEDIARIHNEFKLSPPHIFKGSSDDIKIVEAATNFLYDVVYVDGNHSHEGALFDLNTYSPVVKSGGYLVIDDAACRTKQPFGYFQGIDTVCAALEDWEKTELAKSFEFQFNVVHLMIYKRK